MSTLFFESGSRVQVLLITALGLVFFIPFLGYVHLFDWDEINFAESAREMILSGDYFRVQVDFEPFWEKPPLFFWLQALCMHVFGVNEFAARLPNALFGVLTLVTFFLVGKKLYDARFGMLWVLLYLGSFLPHLYFKSGIIDPVFNYFIFISVYFLFRSVQNEGKSTLFAFLAGLSNGLAVLTKGPVGFGILLLTFLVFWGSRRFRRLSSFKNVLVFGVTFVAVTFFWYGFEFIQNGPWFLVEFVEYQIELLTQPVAGHGQPFYYHFVVVFLGCFPMSILSLGAFVAKDRFPRSGFNIWIKILFWVVMILFSLVKTKIVHYSSMAYPPLAFLAAYHVYQLVQQQQILKKYMLYFLYIFGAVFAALLTLLPIFVYQKGHFLPYIDDPFAVEALSLPVYWSGYEFLIGLIYLFLVLMGLYLFKKGRFKRGILALSLSTALCLMVYTAVVVPKVEAHSQRSAIDFYKGLEGKDVYVTTFGFKSYAQYFYFKKPEGQRPESKDLQWLLSGNIDKPVYFVCKIQHRERLAAYSGVEILEERGGFVLMTRKTTYE